MMAGVLGSVVVLNCFSHFSGHCDKMAYKRILRTPLVSLTVGGDRPSQWEEDSRNMPQLIISYPPSQSREMNAMSSPLFHLWIV